MQVATNFLLLLSVVNLGISAPAPQNHLEIVLKWLHHYGYYKGTLDLPVNKLADALVQPLMVLKAEDGIEPVDGEITAKVLEIINAPRCNKKDSGAEVVKRWARLGSTLWSKMPVSISFKNYLTRDVGKSDQIAVLKECATLWARDSGLSFNILSSGVGNIELEYMYLDGAWKTVGTALSPTPWNDQPSYLRLDDSEKWKPRNLPGSSRRQVSLRWAMCHELGHNLGMGHSSQRDAIMYSSGMGQDETKLHADDRTGIQSLYGRSNGQTVIGDGSPVQVTQRPTTRQPATRQPTTRRPTTRQPTTKQPTTRRPTTKQPTTRRPTTRQPTTKQPATRQPTTKRPTTRRPTTRQPTTRQPIVRQRTTTAFPTTTTFPTTATESRTTTTEQLRRPTFETTWSPYQLYLQRRRNYLSSLPWHVRYYAFRGHNGK